MKRRRITIDINSVVPYYRYGWLPGIGRTTKELVETLDALSLPFDITLFSQNMKGIGGRNLQTHFDSRHLYAPYRQWVCKTLNTVPVREWYTGCDLVHIPHNFDYVRRPDQTIVTLHDAMFFSYPEPMYNPDFARTNYTALARRCRGIITCSESSKRDIMQYMGIAEEKIAVCPWGYDKELFRPITLPNTGKPYFLMVSCDLGRKNTLSLIKAYERFVRLGSPEHELVLVWLKPPQDVVAYCNQPHLRKFIYILESIDDARLSRLYNEATATFYPSRYEGFGLPVLESLACGTPVVTCRNSSLPEVGGDAAFYVDADDVEGMTRYMEMFENGTLNKEALQAQCVAQAAKFSWQRCAEQTAQFYEQCLAD